MAVCSGGSHARGSGFRRKQHLRKATPVPAGAMLIERNDDPGLRTVFKVKYVADGVAYLEGGRAQGLVEGMKLQVEETNLPTRQGASAHPANDARVVAELEVSGVAETSAVTEIHEPKRPGEGRGIWLNLSVKRYCFACGTESAQFDAPVSRGDFV